MAALLFRHGLHVREDDAEGEDMDELTRVPVSMPWRLVVPGYVVLDPHEREWMVGARLELSVGLTFRIDRDNEWGESEVEAVTVDPDKIVRVLVPPA